MVPICCSFIFTNVVFTACSQAADISLQYSSSEKGTEILSGYPNKTKSPLPGKQTEFESVSETYRKQAQSTNTTGTSVVPEPVLSCLPKDIKELALAAFITYEGKSYYLMNLIVSRNDRASGVSYDIALVSLAGTECTLLTPKERANELFTVSLTKFVPETLANQLTLDSWKREQQRLGSKKALQQFVNEGLQLGPDMIELRPEDVWALNKLEISIPEEAIERMRAREEDDPKRSSQ